MLRHVILSLVAFGILSASSAFGQNSGPAQSQPCIGIKMATGTDLDDRMAKLNAMATDLKSRMEKAASGSAEKKAIEKELLDVQAQLLDLVFERECIRSDKTIQVLRAPGDPPPAWLEITTFFATNRTATGNALPDNFFGSDRRPDLQFGRTVVSIPTARQPGDLNLPSLWKFEFSADPSKHFIFKSITPLDSTVAVAEMAKIIGQSSKKSLLVFVHGYNVGFSDAALRTAQLAHDLAFPGTAVFFSWPSAATTKGYWRDEETVQLSEGAFNDFLDKIAGLGASDIFLIAHSMGNRLVTTVLSDRASKGKVVPNLRELLLAAPDINAEIFREKILPGLSTLAAHRTIYASSSDVALRASKVVHDYRRVGETEGGVLTFAGFETIDASSVAPLMRAFGHSYVVDSTKVLGDIAETLSMRLNADQRNLQRHGTPPAAWWLLK
jgi:esterase/lipase superfamily enzyme